MLIQEYGRFAQSIQAAFNNYEGSPNTFAECLLPRLADFIKFDVLGIWTLNANKDMLIPRYCYLRSKNKFITPAPISMKDCPQYFDFILHYQRIITTSPLNHPALVELCDRTIIPNNITAVLDVPITVGKTIVGMLRAEMRGTKPEWIDADLALIQGMSDYYAHICLISRKRRLYRELQSLKKKNSELNTTIVHLLNGQNQLKQKIESTVAYNVHQRITPMLEHMRKSVTITSRDLDLLESMLHSLTSPQIQVQHKLLQLTQQEQLIIEKMTAGFSTKEIARQLSLSEQTIQTHKKNIRKKLHLKGEKVNLQTFLNQLGMCNTH